jgi:peptidylprolyl isomerase
MRHPTGIATFLCLVLSVAAGCSSSHKASESASASATPSIPAPPDVAAVPPDATRTPTGLASKVLRPGTGTRHPRPDSQVVVHYTGWTTDGKMFDSSVARGEPATMSLDGVIAGWTEGVQMMVVGEKRRFWIPARLAYEGKDGPQGLLVFDIELIRIES